MKKKTKIVVATVAVTITSLMITTYCTEQVTSPVSPQIAPVSEIVVVCRATTPPAETEPIVAEVIEQISTQTKEIIKSTTVETSPPQPTENTQSTSTPTAPTQTAAKPIAQTKTEETTPKNGDTRIVDGKQQGYLLGFGWVDYMGENEVVYCEGMYENSNKIGIMD